VKNKTPEEKAIDFAYKHWPGKEDYDWMFRSGAVAGYVEGHAEGTREREEEVERLRKRELFLDSAESDAIARCSALEAPVAELERALEEASEYGHEFDCSHDRGPGLECDCRLAVLDAALARLRAARSGGGEEGFTPDIPGN
jgi:hypothetical protein